MYKKLFIIAVAFALAACANRGIGPQGGPKDSIPPVPVRFDPEPGTLNFTGKRIEVHFDEYIQLDNIAQHLLMSPPQQTPPDVKAIGKRLTVQFQDTLRDSTTYTIDFGSAVCDFREKVPLHGFSFYFSTGPEIDTLEMCGHLYDALTLNPVKGMLVGIQNDLEDSAFTTKPFLRIARTDSAGGFCIRNIHPGTYRLYAVDDVSRDYRLTVGEAMAFQDTAIRILPSVPADTATLFLFKEEQQRLYLVRTLRDQQHRIQIFFSAPSDSLPEFSVIRPSRLNSYTSHSAHRDTLTIWLLDSTSISEDSIFLEARYRRTDSLYNLEWCTDTLRAIWRAPRLSAKAKEAKLREAKNRRLELKSNARNGFEIYDTIRVTCTTPIASIERDSIRLMERVDTLFKPVPFTIAPYDTLPMVFRLLADLKAGGKYELRLDSGAVHDVYGITHPATKYPLQVKVPADYSTLRVKLTPYDASARIQVLSNKDQVLRELPAAEEGAFFEYLKPDTYYLRLYLDKNGDGQWTTGCWSDKRQPEPIWYFPGKIQTKSNWDFEEEWDYTATPQTSSKPKELIKVNAKK